MNIKTIALFAGLAIGLPGCQLLTNSADLAADTILASVEVDAMQTKLGNYVDNQTALDEVDALQADILGTLTTGKGVENLLSYQARGLIAHANLRDEALSRWNELSTEQQANLVDLDNQLIALNDEFNATKESAGFTTEILDILYRAAILMTYYKAI